MKQVWAVVKESVLAWVRDGAPSMGAALAFYCAFSIAPLLVIVIGIAGIAFGSQQAESAIVAQLHGLMGEQGARAVETILAGSRLRESGWLATIIGTLTLIVGATSVFGELESALNRIWQAPPRSGSGLMEFLRARLLSFGLVLGLGFLLLVSLLVTTALTAFSKQYSGYLPAGVVFLHAANFFVSFGVVTVLFAVIYKWLPNVSIAWRDVWAGAAVTALLFNVGRAGIGFYLGNTAGTSAYGAAGAFVLMLLWLYYSAQIFLLGAEFTWVYAKARREATARRNPPPAAPFAALAPERPVPGESESQALVPSALRELIPLVVAAGGFFTGRMLGKARFK
jgi:membrane protein